MQSRIRVEEDRIPSSFPPTNGDRNAGEGKSSTPPLVPKKELDTEGASDTASANAAPTPAPPSMEKKPSIKVTKFAKEICDELKLSGKVDEMRKTLSAGLQDRVSSPVEFSLSLYILPV
jgi:hypothetical protein